MLTLKAKEKELKKSIKTSKRKSKAQIKKLEANQKCAICDEDESSHQERFSCKVCFEQLPVEDSKDDQNRFD